MQEITIKELGHIVLYVRDVERSAKFYEEVLGWKRIGIPSGMPAAVFSSGRTHHELLLIEVGPNAKPIPSGNRVGLYHFGLKIGDSLDDLKRAASKLEREGIPYGMADHTVSNSLYIEDPDGNEIELYIDVPGVDWKNHPELVMNPTKPLHLK